MNKLFEKDKRKRMLTMAAVGICIATLIWFTLDIGKSKPEKKAELPTVNIVKKESTLEEGFRSRFSEDLVSLKESNTQIKKELDALKTKSEKLESENAQLKTEVAVTTGMMSGTLKLPEPEQTESGGLKVPPPPTSPKVSANTNTNSGRYPDPNAAQPIVTVVTGLISVGQPIGKQEEKPVSPKVSKKNELIIPAGSFVKASLLSGVIAPTMGQGASDPVPVLIRVTGLTQLPNFFNADIKNCFLLAETKGNLATETVSFRLKSLACKKGNGTTVEKAVDGYVTGENGVEGLQGRVVSKQGALIARAFAAEFLGGMSKAFEESGKTVSTTGSGLVTTFDPNKALQTGLFSGASGAFTRVSEFYMDLADNMVPVIEINAGRKVDVVFIKAVDFSEGEGK